MQDGRSHVVGRVPVAVALSHRVWRRPSRIFLYVCVDNTGSGTGRDAVAVHSVLERRSSCQGKCGGSGDKLWVLCVSNMT